MSHQLFFRNKITFSFALKWIIRPGWIRFWHRSTQSEMTRATFLQKQTEPVLHFSVTFPQTERFWWWEITRLQPLSACKVQITRKVWDLLQDCSDWRLPVRQSGAFIQFSGRLQRLGPLFTTAAFINDCVVGVVLTDRGRASDSAAQK